MLEDRKDKAGRIKGEGVGGREEKAVSKGYAAHFSSIVLLVEQSVPNADKIPSIKQTADRSFQ